MTQVKHQVFVSSTFLDLQEERREVMQALLELDCIPAGMELFPASDDESWTLIRRVIDECDYYVVIVGNRYGSMTPDGLSFTEKEYDYALSHGLPVLGFVPKSPDSIAIGKSDTEVEKRMHLDRFRTKVLAKNCKHYDGPEDLGGKVSRALLQAMKTHPRPGWVRAGKGGDPNLVERLRAEIEELRDQLTAAREMPPKGTESLAQGAETFMLAYSFSAGMDSYTAQVDLSWERIFAHLGPSLIHEATETKMADALNRLITDECSDVHTKKLGRRGYGYKLDPNSFDTIKIQLAALGLIKLSDSKRRVADRAAYWCLTPYGATYLTRLRAVPGATSQVPESRAKKTRRSR